MGLSDLHYGMRSDKADPDEPNPLLAGVCAWNAGNIANIRASVGRYD